MLLRVAVVHETHLLVCIPPACTLPHRLVLFVAGTTGVLNNVHLSQLFSHINDVFNFGWHLLTRCMPFCVGYTTQDCQVSIFSSFTFIYSKIE